MHPSLVPPDGNIVVADDGTQPEAAVARPGGFMSSYSSCVLRPAPRSCDRASVFPNRSSLLRYLLTPSWKGERIRRPADPDGTFGPAGPGCDLGTLRA